LIDRLTGKFKNGDVEEVKQFLDEVSIFIFHQQSNQRSSSDSQTNSFPSILWPFNNFSCPSNSFV